MRDLGTQHVLGGSKIDHVGFFDNLIVFGCVDMAHMEAMLDSCWCHFRNKGDIFGTPWLNVALLSRSLKEVRFQGDFEAIWEPLGGVKTSISLQRGCKNQLLRR